MLSLGFFTSYAEAQTFEMHVKKMPSHWEKQFGDILSKATQYWEAWIPGLKLDTVKFVDQADFVVEWASQYGNGNLGYYSTNTANEYGKPKLTISLGFFKDKKYHTNAEKLNTDGGAFFVQSKYQDSYQKFKSSYDYCKKAGKEASRYNKIPQKSL